MYYGIIFISKLATKEKKQVSKNGGDGEGLFKEGEDVKKRKNFLKYL